MGDYVPTDHQKRVVLVCRDADRAALNAALAELNGGTGPMTAALENQAGTENWWACSWQMLATTYDAVLAAIRSAGLSGKVDVGVSDWAPAKPRLPEAIRKWQGRNLKFKQTA